MKFNVSTLAPYAKAVVAIAGAIGVTATAFVDGTVDNTELAAIATAWSTAYGVFRATNAPLKG